MARKCPRTAEALNGPVGYRGSVLEAGDPVPNVHVWAAPRAEAEPLKEILGAGLSLLAFYVYDWSPT